MKNLLLNNLGKLSVFLVGVVPILCLISAIVSYNMGHGVGIFLSSLCALLMIIVYTIMIVIGKLIADVHDIKKLLALNVGKEKLEGILGKVEYDTQKFELEATSMEDAFKQVEDLVKSGKVPQNIADQLKERITNDFATKDFFSDEEDTDGDIDGDSKADLG